MAATASATVCWMLRISPPISFVGALALGQLAHFVRHHREHFAVLARPRRLNGGVQRHGVPTI
jgi:hypothetical protein